MILYNIKKKKKSVEVHRNLKAPYKPIQTKEKQFEGTTFTES